MAVTPFTEDPQARADIALMERMRDGDEEAVIALVGRYQDELVGFFYHLCWDQTIAEELAQDVFVHLFQARARYQPTARPRTFIYRIAHNLWIDHLRRTRHRVSLDAELGDGELRLVDVLEAPAAAGEAGEDRDGMIRGRVRQALEALPEGQREVFVMANDLGLKYQDIATMLGIPEGTVKSRMHHAVRHLRDELADLVEESP